MIKISLIPSTELVSNHTVFLYGDEVPAKVLPFKKEEISYLSERRDASADDLVVLNRFAKDGSRNVTYIQNFDSSAATAESVEKLRRAACSIQEMLVKEKATTVSISGEGVIPEEVMAFLEGLVLSNYRFDKYMSKKEVLLQEVFVDDRFFKAEELNCSLRLWSRIYQCRDWVNEPVMALNAERFANLIQEEGNKAGIKVTVMGQKQIESLKMGGLLAVNKGSVDEARFVMLEYKPKKSINSHPIALVGKGITYDTGGLNIKPDEHMREMKSDMAGAATAVATTLAAADNDLPVHLMTFIPLTDNRPCGNAYAADDILTMYDGTTVEVVNTDAEGRLILADAIAFANQYEPELIIDMATLTGAAVRAIGTIGIAAMQQDAENPLNLLKLVGDQVYERLAIFPFWKEYDELLKSEVADLQNCANKAGCITAGKFLAHFAKHPYIHLDIAGVAYYPQKESFYGVGGSGFGIRLLYAFLQTYDIVD